MDLPEFLQTLEMASYEGVFAEAMTMTRNRTIIALLAGRLALRLSRRNAARQFGRQIAVCLLLAAAMFAAGCQPEPSAPPPAPAPPATPNEPRQEQDKDAESFVPDKELRLHFVAQDGLEKPEDEAKKLADALEAKLGLRVKITLADRKADVIKAMESKQAELAIVPPEDYVYLHDEKQAASPLLLALDYRIEDETGEATTELVASHKAVIVVKADSPVRTVAALKGRTIAWQTVSSLTGYVWPANELKRQGIDPERDLTGIEIKGHDRAVMAVLNDQVDAAAVFQDARALIAGRIPDVFDRTRVLLYTAPIPNDVVVVRSDMDDAWKRRIAAALIDVSATGGEAHFPVYLLLSHLGYKAASDAAFATVREYTKGSGADGAK